MLLFSAKVNIMMYTSLGWKSTHLSLLNFAATDRSPVLQCKTGWILHSYHHFTSPCSKEGTIRFSHAASRLAYLYESMSVLHSHFMVSHDIWPAKVVMQKVHNHDSRMFDQKVILVFK